jgi:hypothetical protein
MNIARLALAALAGLVVEIVYGFVVYGMLLSNEFGKYPALYRSAETGPGYLPLMFGGLLVAIAGAAAIYAKGYEGGSGVAEGARFGVLLGLFTAFAFANVNYGVLNMGRRLAVYTAVASFVEWFLIGVAIGAVYKPSQTASRPAAGV